MEKNQERSPDGSGKGKESNHIEICPKCSPKQIGYRQDRNRGLRSTKYYI